MAWRGQSGKNGGHKGEKGSSRGAGKWQYWSGSWSPSQGGNAPWRKSQGKGQENRQALSFPGYDAAQKEEKHISEVASTKEKEGDSYANALQRAINQVRKAESRVRKAHTDKKARATQWSNWVMELRRTFAKKKSRYQAAISRLEREMEEALLEQEGAQKRAWKWTPFRASPRQWKLAQSSMHLCKRSCAWRNPRNPMQRF